MRHFELGALCAFARLGWRRSAAERTTTIGLLLLYWLVLLIFWGLWQATPAAELLAANASPASLFWYLVVTECIALAVGYPYHHIEADINSGDIAAGLMRPIPYAMATLAEWLGQTSHRVVVLGGGGIAAGLWITGSVPVPLATLPALMLSIAIGSTCALLCQLQLGYAAAWVGSSAPLFWIWQKLFFVLGGLMLPLTLYPPPLRLLSNSTPFASMLFAPGSMVFRASATSTAATLASQLAWMVALGIATWLVDRAAATRFATRGI